MLIEIKNNTGEFTVNKDHLYSYASKKEYDHPLHQLQRSKNFLQKTLPQLECKLPMEPFVIFVNQAFPLFQAEQGPFIILPIQINSFIQQLNNENRKPGSQQHQLARRLTALHRNNPPYIKLPHYEYGTLRKGVVCHECREMMSIIKRQFSCSNCSYMECTDSGVLRQVIEYSILFPNKK